MDAVVFYPKNEEEIRKIVSFSTENNIPAVQLTEEEKRGLAGILLANLAKKNPKAYATDEEIISVVEEVRQERYGKKH